ncbi:MAG: radical SAM protein, partial [Sandaracinaceae bacterium]|nr:radical SAM protein [Sandaracinaceae bacterium]
MNHAAVTRSLDSAVRRMLAPLLAAEPGPTQWRLVDWDCETGISITLARGDVVLLIELEARDDARGCHARTARFNVGARRASDEEPLAPDERRAVDRLVALVREREETLPWASPRPEPSARVALRLLSSERVLIGEGAGRYYINPYVGCVIGCEFCYAADRAELSRRLDGQPAARWGRFVDVKIDAPEVLRREVKDRPPGIVRLSPIVTDPYQSIERKYRVTRRCLEVLLEAGFTPVVLTRSANVLDDLELLARFPRSAVGLSIPTDDDAMRAAFEPGGDPIEARLNALERLHDAGVTTFVVVQPTLPMNEARLVERVAPFVHAARIDRMHERSRVRHLYERAGRLDAMSDAFAERTARRLRAGLDRHGIAVDESDDLAGLLERPLSGTSRLTHLYDRLYDASTRAEAGEAHAAFMS